MSRCRAVVVACPHEVEPTGGLTREFRHGGDGKMVILGFDPPSS